MNTLQNRIAKVELELYNFKKDIANRRLLSSLNAFELEILREIAYSSLKFPIKELTGALNVDYQLIHPFLSRLTDIGLLKIEANVVLVEKDLRRYFESQLCKFDDEFEPNMDYVQTLLQQVPIHVLPLWYSLPKNTDDIFGSIIEKHLSTPKIYGKYLGELVFENPKQEGIVRDVLNSKELSLSTNSLKKKYQLDENEFVECMLYLEYSLAVFCIFVETENGFEEMVVPLQEWKTWIQFHVNTVCKPLDTASIDRHHSSDFVFVEEMAKVILEIGKGGNPSFDEALSSKLTSLSLIEEKSGKYKVTAAGLEWASKKPQEKAMALYLHMMNRLRRKEISDKFTDKDVREIEKSLKRVLKSGWVFLDDFFKGMYASVGDAEPVSLKKKGKKWGFMLPSYSDSEKAFITYTVMDFLFESAMVAKGTYQGKPCFTLTPFGQIALGE